MTDVERLDEIREHLHHNRVLHESDAHFLLSQLDVTNRMIAWYDKCMEAQRQGIADYLDGKAVEACPYDDEDLRDLWVMTWNEAKRDAEKDAEIERLRKIEEAAWNAIETVPFGAHDVYQADIRAMGNLSAVLEQNRGDKA
ncbi:Rmf/CrpP family protein [Alicyclobacillus suci]|uniref:Rmf/CrpP family protein n=1 Tax=Alicyclobacillus suci TaxID=2816080 RepID=UPI001A8E82AA|nr:Rmf/CrpP family protein [Alicyclobacillus suci]